MITCIKDFKALNENGGVQSFVVKYTLNDKPQYQKVNAISLEVAIEKLTKQLNNPNAKDFVAKPYIHFTFKTEKPTGRYSSFYDNTNLIKVKGNTVGSISNASTVKNTKAQISLQVYKTEEDKAKPGNNSKTEWKRITFKREFDTVKEAQDWLTRNEDAINMQYNLFIR